HWRCGGKTCRIKRMTTAPAQKPPYLTWATKVTIARILGIPVFVLLLVYYNLSLGTGRPDETYRIAALALFAVISVTDALDGYLARSRGEITALGRVLDPLADKFLLLSAVIMMTRPGLAAVRGQLPVWFALTVISRDAILLLGVAVVHHFTGHVEVRPRWTGKIATFLQMSTVVWLLAVRNHPGVFFVWVAAAAATFTAVSGIQYVIDGLKQLEFHHARTP
ncbi:MAG: CDP-alcohol phosphatidyltransferase family protein, partial [Kiritimatiellia bacterium]|nr:CDP-alcohol phosphatidyltransferase family protein [Kiritimatiellia bacterium]